MTRAYEYRLPARRPSIWLAFAILICVLLFAVVNAGPWYLWVICAVSLPKVIYGLVRNPISGISVTDQTMTLSAWRRPRPISLSNIERVEITDWTERTYVEIHLVGGEKISLSSADTPPALDLAKALKQRKVAVCLR